jgi:hypothetical protein
MADTSQIKEHMDIISSDKKIVDKVDHLEASDKTKLTKQVRPTGTIPRCLDDRIDQRVHPTKSGEGVSAHWQHEGHK